MGTAAAIKAVFAIGGMYGGGSERQMVSLLRHLDTRRFRPSLYLASRAGPLLEEADRWAQKIDPDRGLITASVRIAQGRLALAQHDSERARYLFNMALTIRRDRLPAGHPDLVEVEQRLLSLK